IAAVFPADNVIDLVRGKRIVLMQQAVLATAGGPLHYEQAYRARNLLAHDADLGSQAELRSCLRHNHQMFEAEILFEFLVLYGRDFLFASALNQLAYARHGFIRRPEGGDTLGGRAGSEKIEDLIVGLRQGHPIVMIPRLGRSFREQCVPGWQTTKTDRPPYWNNASAPR
ncbi:MAG TPA: hypothetical protein VKJ01_05825, partial [Candidatus Solibacter sp.]|nr:hypothetical protein [Candidatus Solibacter sp.]